MKKTSELKQLIKSSKTLQELFSEACETAKRKYPDMSQEEVEKHVLKLWSDISQNTRLSKASNIICIAPPEFEAHMAGIKQIHGVIN
jgi:hypothetical protein